jgi:hypothetical protein
MKTENKKDYYDFRLRIWLREQEAQYRYLAKGHKSKYRGIKKYYD